MERAYRAQLRLTFSVQIDISRGSESRKVWAQPIIVEKENHVSHKKNADWKHEPPSFP